MLIQDAFRLSGGDWGAGREHLHLLREFGIEGNVSAGVLALPPGHPYLRLPLQFATALEEKLLFLVSAAELEKLSKEGEAEIQEPGRWGTTFTLLQGAVPVDRCAPPLSLHAKRKRGGRHREPPSGARQSGRTDERHRVLAKRSSRRSPSASGQTKMRSARAC